jgi:predicted dehydrogenase
LCAAERIALLEIFNRTIFQGENNAMSCLPFLDRRDFSKKLSLGLTAGLVGGRLASATTEETPIQSFGVAVAGLGNLATGSIIPALHSTKFCSLAAILTGSPSKAKPWLCHTPKLNDHLYDYRHVNDMLKDKTVDAVVLCLPTARQEELAVCILEAGKHVFCQTPIATSMQSAQRMIDAAKASSRRLAINDGALSDAVSIQEVNDLHQTVQGKIQSIHIRLASPPSGNSKWRLRRSLSGGGALMSSGQDAIRIANRLADSRLQSVTAQETKRDAIQFSQVDESMTWTMNFENGITAYCATAFRLNEPSYIEVRTDRQSHRLDLPNLHGNAHLASSLNRHSTIQRYSTAFDQFAWQIGKQESGEHHWQAALSNLQVVNAVYRSALQSRTVVLG